MSADSTRFQSDFFLDKRAGDEIGSEILKHTTRRGWWNRPDNSFNIYEDDQLMISDFSLLATVNIQVLYCFTAGLCRNELFTSGKEQYGHQSQLRIPPERCNRPTRLDVSSRMPRSVLAHSPLSILSIYLYRMTNRMGKFLGGGHYLEARLYVQTTLWVRSNSLHLNCAQELIRNSGRRLGGSCRCRSQ